MATKKLSNEIKFTSRDLWDACGKRGMTIVVYGGARDRDGVTYFTRDVVSMTEGFRVECPNYAPSTVTEKRDDLCNECGKDDCDRKCLNVIERVLILEAPKL